VQYIALEPSPASRSAQTGIIAKRPHSFQIVKIPYFGTEQVDDHVVRIDQHPIRCREPFDPNAFAKLRFDLFCKLNGHRRDLPRRSARGDHHVVRDVRFAGERDGDDFLRLIVVKRLKNDTVKLFDVNGTAAVTGGLSGTFGQGVSWRTKASQRAELAKRADSPGGANWVQARELRSTTKDRAAGEAG
jgi:hypothetical protein